MNKKKYLFKKPLENNFKLRGIKVGRKIRVQPIEAN